MYANEDQERQAKEHLLRHNLFVYLNVCVAVGHTNRALSTLLNYRDRTKRINGKKSLLTIDLYNIIMQGYADRGMHGKIMEILRYIEEDELQLNEQSFVAIFTSLSRHSKEDNLSTSSSTILTNLTVNNNDAEDDHSHVIIRNHIKQAENGCNFTLHQIMDKSKFLGDQRDRFTEVIRRVIPNFEPSYTAPDLFYKNRLLNHLNDGIVEECTEIITKDGEQQAEEGKASDPMEKLRHLAREQLAIELEGSITIKSIANREENGQNNDMHVNDY